MRLYQHLSVISTDLSLRIGRATGRSPKWRRQTQHDFLRSELTSGLLHTPLAPYTGCIKTAANASLPCSLSLYLYLHGKFEGSVRLLRSALTQASRLTSHTHTYLPVQTASSYTPRALARPLIRTQFLMTNTGIALCERYARLVRTKSSSFLNRTVISVRNG
jgi:hypothetical protein